MHLVTPDVRRHRGIFKSRRGFTGRKYSHIKLDDVGQRQGQILEALLSPRHVLASTIAIPIDIPAPASSTSSFSVEDTAPSANFLA